MPSISTDRADLLLFLCTVLLLFSATLLRAQNEPPQDLSAADDSIPAANIHADPAFAKLSNKELIDQLQSITFESDDEDFEHMSAFVLCDFHGFFDDLQTPRVPPVFREIVRRGLTIVPLLLDHLDDDRPTGFRRAGHNFKVGDFCYMAVGQILYRGYSVVEHSGWYSVDITSPVDLPELADKVRAENAEVDSEFLLQKLTTESLNYGWYFHYGAVRRLCCYFPREAEPTVVRLLERPVYDDTRMWDFIRYELTAQHDPSKWPALIESYVKHNGQHVKSVLPYWLYWIYHKTDVAKSEQFLLKRKNADEILKRHFPDFVPGQATFRNVARCNDFVYLVQSLHFYHSAKVDEAIHKLFINVRDAEFAKPFHPGAMNDEYYRDRLNEACVQRLIKTEYAESCRRWCEKKISELEKQDPKPLGEIDTWHVLMTGRRKYFGLSMSQLDTLEELQDSNISMWFDEDYGLFGHFFASPETEPIEDKHIQLIAKFKQLRKLSIESERVTDNGIGVLKSLTDLRNLRLESTRISGSGLAFLKSLQKLEALDLSGSMITSGLEHLNELEKLEVLNLQDCPITDLSPLQSSSIKRLNHSNTNISSGLTQFESLPSLEHLDLTGCDAVTDEDLVGLGALEKLQTVAIESKHVGDPTLEVLSSCIALQQIELKQCCASPAAVTRLQEALPHATIHYEWDFTIEQVGTDVFVDTPWLRVAIENATWREPVNGHVALCGKQSRSLSSLGANYYSAVSEDGRVDVFLMCLDLEQADKKRPCRFFIMDNGSSLRIRDTFFSIQSEKVTVRVLSDGTAQLASDE